MLTSPLLLLLILLLPLFPLLLLISPLESPLPFEFPTLLLPPLSPVLALPFPTLFEVPPLFDPPLLGTCRSGDFTLPPLIEDGLDV